MAKADTVATTPADPVVKPTEALAGGRRLTLPPSGGVVRRRSEADQLEAELGIVARTHAEDGGDAEVNAARQGCCGQPQRALGPHRLPRGVLLVATPKQAAAFAQQYLEARDPRGAPSVSFSTPLVGGVQQSLRPVEASMRCSPAQFIERTVT